MQETTPGRPAFGTVRASCAGSFAEPRPQEIYVRPHPQSGLPGAWVDVCAAQGCSNIAAACMPRPPYRLCEEHAAARKPGMPCPSCGGKAKSGVRRLFPDCRACGDTGVC